VKKAHWFEKNICISTMYTKNMRPLYGSIIFLTNTIWFT
jgi:hypothetical protein